MSTLHGDVYYSAADGLAEARHVFLAGNNLPAAWQNRTSFTIGETGFGMGLNFLATWQMWRRAAPPASRLHYISVEGFPPTAEDLERAHTPFAELAPLARRLRALYPHLYGGFHRLHFDEDRVTLTLLFGEAKEMLEALDARVDAWFLDGFSPARNPDLWRQEVLDRIGALTGPGGTAASFTVAGAVRRGLEVAGYRVEKAAGFGRKRHMLRARHTATMVKAAKSWTGAPLDAPPSTALLIGAGLAGSAVSRALTRRGIAVALIDPDPDLVMAASGNPAGIANPKPAADISPAGRFHCAAFDYAARHVFHEAPDVFRPCGVLELAAGPQAQRRYEGLSAGRVLPATAMQALSVEDAAQAAGLPLSLAALYFPKGGIAFPPAYTASLREGADRVRGRVTRLSPAGRGWTAELEGGGQVSADIAILACGNDCGMFGLTNAIPMTASRGQLSLVPETEESAALRTAISFGGYVSPALSGRHVLGATYDDVAWPLTSDAYAARQADHHRNQQALADVLPDFPLRPCTTNWDARVAFRCTTPDRLPLCGPVPDLPDVPVERSRMRDSLPTDRQLHPPYRNGLYLCTGLGSRGLTTAPLLGELLASTMCGDPLPTERVVAELLHPMRFFVRALRKAGFAVHP